MVWILSQLPILYFRYPHLLSFSSSLDTLGTRNTASRGSGACCKYLLPPRMATHNSARSVFPPAGRLANTCGLGSTVAGSSSFNVPIIPESHQSGRG